MIIQKRTKTRGFTLTELAIVMSVIGVLLAGIWSYASTARQSQRVATSVQSILQVAQGTRDTFVAASSLSGGISTLVPALVQASVIPVNLLRSATSACGTGAAALYADTPWNPSQTDGCGTFRVCAWNYSGATAYTANTSCINTVGTSTQYFAIEFTQLDYGSCLSLAEGISPYQLAGLKDIYINKNSMITNGGGLPVAPSVAAAAGTGCKSGITTNTVDFIYTLRSPLS